MLIGIIYSVYRWKYEYILCGKDSLLSEACHILKSEKGLALVRVLGDNMRPENMVKLMNAIDKGDVDLNGLKSIADSFKTYGTDGPKTMGSF